MEKVTHPTAVFSIHERILKESSAQERYIKVGEGHKIHIIEAGEGQRWFICMEGVPQRIRCCQS